MSSRKGSNTGFKLNDCKLICQNIYFKATVPLENCIICGHRCDLKCKHYTHSHNPMPVLFLNCNFFHPFSFVLNTTIAAAHEDQIISMCFSSSEETTMLVTTAKDSQFKAWVQGSNADTQRESHTIDICMSVSVGMRSLMWRLRVWM